MTKVRVDAMLATKAEAPVHGISFREAVGTWAKVAALSFGGPAGQIATMHRILVEEKKWIGETRFLHALNYCMLLPGPEAQQLYSHYYNGTRRRGVAQHSIGQGLICRLEPDEHECVDAGSGGRSARGRERIRALNLAYPVITHTPNM
jgi:hypothetical protein